VKKIVQFIDSHPGCTRKLLFDYFSQRRTETAGAPREPAPETPRRISAEETALITDLHWLIHQGHVIEFADG